MKHRDSIIDEIHRLRERMGRAHDFDADRIAMTIRQHEREAGRPVVNTTPRRTKAVQLRRGRAAQQGDRHAAGHSDQTVTCHVPSTSGTLGAKHRTQAHRRRAHLTSDSHINGGPEGLHYDWRGVGAHVVQAFGSA